MSSYVTGVSEDLQEECRATSWQYGCSSLMIHAQQVYESRQT